jgi:hypothetical protein
MDAPDRKMSEEERSLRHHTSLLEDPLEAFQRAFANWPPHAKPGTILERGGRMYVVAHDGSVRRVKE